MSQLHARISVAVGIRRGIPNTGDIGSTSEACFETEAPLQFVSFRCRPSPDARIASSSNHVTSSGQCVVYRTAGALYDRVIRLLKPDLPFLRTSEGSSTSLATRLVDLIGRLRESVSLGADQGLRYVSVSAYRSEAQFS